MPLSPADLLEALQPCRGRRRWLLGLSGGLDSVVLLHLLFELRKRENLPPLLAIHVNHQLSSSASAWSQYCQRLCKQLEVELEVREVEVKAGGRGPEAAARDARYQVFEELVQENETLLLAHHLDDQIETFFLRLLRGAGTRGLSGMPVRRKLARGELFRPLLGFQRQHLEAYAKAHNLEWVEDDSNTDTRLNRNYLRQEVLPLLEKRWPGYRKSVIRGVDAIRDAEGQLGAMQGDPLPVAMGWDFGEATLELSVLEHCSAQEASRLLRSWLQRLGLPNPGRDQLREFLQQLREAALDRKPELHSASYIVRRYRDKLYAGRSMVGTALPAGQQLKPGQELTLPGQGCLDLVLAKGAGIRADIAADMEVAFRRGGERCHPSGREHGQSLKKLFQEHGVPPWWRDRLPLLVSGSELVAVADLWICKGFQANGDEDGYRVLWKPNSLAPCD